MSSPINEVAHQNTTTSLGLRAVCATSLPRAGTLELWQPLSQGI